MKRFGIMRTVVTYFRVFGIRAPFYIIYSLFFKVPKAAKVAHHWSKHPLFIRVHSTDIEVFRQVFMRKEYQIINEANGPLHTVVDAGANIGLTSVFIADRCDAASILAVEPEAANFALLQINTQRYEHIQCVRAAVWDHDGGVRIENADAGNWAFRVGNAVGGSFAEAIPSMRMSTLMRTFNLSRVSLLKMDIEGAELEVFGDADGWIDWVDNIVIELHDRLRPGCSDCFGGAIRSFRIVTTAGELTLACRSAQAT